MTIAIPPRTAPMAIPAFDAALRPGEAGARDGVGKGARVDLAGFAVAEVAAPLVEAVME